MTKMSRIDKNDKNIEQRYRVIIEIPKGNMNNKYEFHEDSGEFKLDFVFENLTWPYNYGFFPRTLAGDGDTVDAIVLSFALIKQGTAVDCKVIGMLEVLDRREEDNKIICVPADDQLSQNLNDITDVSDAQKQEWVQFLQELARQKKKTVEIKGFLGKDRAEDEIKKSVLK